MWFVACENGTRSVPITKNIRGAMNCATTNVLCLNSMSFLEMLYKDKSGLETPPTIELPMTKIWERHAERVYYQEYKRRNELRDY